MPRSAILIFLLFVCQTITNAQQQVSRQDAAEFSVIRQQVETAPHNRSYINAVLQLVGMMQVKLYPEDSILPWLLKAEYIADKLDDKDALLQVYRNRAVTYETISRNYGKALRWYDEALRIAGTEKQKHELFSSILNLNFYLGDFITAMSVASTGLRMAEDGRDDHLVAHYQNVIGFVHLRQQNSAAALRSYDNYHQLAVQMRDTNLIADAYNCLGETYLLQKKFPEALEYFHRAKKVYEDLHARGKLPKHDRLPYTYFKIGFALGSDGRTQDALSYVEQAIAFTRYISCNLYDVANYFIYAGSLYRQMGQHDRSLSMLRSGLALAKRIDHKEDIRDAYLYLHQLFADKGNYDSAYVYYSFFDRLKDSISNEKTKTEIRQIEASYLVDKKDKEIELLLQKQALAEARTNRKLLLRNVVIIFFILVTVIIAFVVNRRELRRRNLHQQEVNRKQHEIFNIVASTQEQERKRIAQDLHDGMGTLLSAAKLKLSAVNEREQTAVSEAIHILDEAVSELRNISHNIMPATLSRIGLVGALQNFFGRVSNPGVSFNFIHHGFTERIGEEKEIILYRVILELVNNAVKHANAGMVTIQLVRYPDHINLTVEDDGEGMQLEAFDKEGIGLNNISSRIEYLKGSFTMDTGKGGTTAIIDIPV